MREEHFEVVSSNRAREYEKRKKNNKHNQNTFKQILSKTIN